MLEVCWQIKKWTSVWTQVSVHWDTKNSSDTSQPIVCHITTMKLFALVVLLSALVQGAVHHKEREEDGAFSPKDRGHHHGKDGEHDAHWDHEAILGSHKEAEEFDDLSPVEAKKRLRILAGKMDRNLDGFVDKTELRQWIVRSFRMLSREDSDEVHID